MSSQSLRSRVLAPRRPASSVEATTIVCNATAGSGKSTTAIAVARRCAALPNTMKSATPEQTAVIDRIHELWLALPPQVRNPENIQFLAFNKSIADELQKKLGPGGNASTIHSFGSKLIYQNFARTIGVPAKSLRCAKSYKTGNLYANEFLGLPRFNDLSKDQRSILDDLVTLVSTAMDQCLTEQDFLSAGDTPEVPSGSTVPSMILERRIKSLIDPNKIPSLVEARFSNLATLLSSSEFDAVCDRIDEFAADHDLEIECETDVLATPFLYILHASTWYPEFSFDDMVYLPNRFGWKSAQTLPLIIVDEAQDLSLGKRRLICNQPAHIRLFIGDRNQAIYAFAGADSRSMSSIVEENKAEENKLTWSFRCSRAVVSHAQRYLADPTDIQSTPTAPQGSVRELPLEKLAETMQPGDLALCRTNAPMLRLAWSLIRQGRSVTVIGGNLGSSLKKIVRRLAPAGATVIPGFIDRLNSWVDNQLTAMRRWKSDTTQRQMTLVDQRDSLLMLSAEVKDVPALLAAIDNLFSPEAKANSLRFSSIHRAKGLEAERVFWLGPELCPHRMAKTPAARLQERNLQFVAATRALTDLYLVPLASTEEPGVVKLENHRCVIEKDESPLADAAMRRAMDKLIRNLPSPGLPSMPKTVDDCLDYLAGDEE